VTLPHGLTAKAAIFTCLWLSSGTSFAAPPEGYLFWVKGTAGDATTRAIYRMALPDGAPEQLTAGEDVEAVVSPDGRWVAYAKAKLPGSDYHQFGRFALYVVSTHGPFDGRQEIRVDDSGYWPSFDAQGALYYTQVDPDDSGHSRILRTVLDDQGYPVEKGLVFETKPAFPNIKEINECSVSPDLSWFAARTRGASSVAGVGGYSMDPPKHHMVAQAGSVGCMPRVAPSGTWAYLAGADKGCLWGDSPFVKNRQENQVLVPIRGSGYKCYHPGISSDEKWVVVAQSQKEDHNAGAYDLYLHTLSGRKAGPEESLVSGGFNGWPNLWIGDLPSIPAPHPRIETFTPSSYTILKGDDVELTWKTVHAGQVTLDKENVEPSGHAVKTPGQTTTYSLVALGESGDTAMSQVTVAVNAANTPVFIESFEITPNPVEAGSTAALSWKILNAYSVDLSGAPVSPEGQLSVSPISDTTYTLTAQGFQGPVSQSILLEVEPIADDWYIEDRGGCLCRLSSAGARPLSKLSPLLALLAVSRTASSQRPTVLEKETRH
jgi:hypothetical protein